MQQQPEHQQHGGGRPDGSRRWTTLSHAGVLFPPIYRASGARVIWGDANGTKVPVVLPPAAEEAIADFVRRGGVIVNNRAMLFGKRQPALNFWEDWAAMLPPGCPIRSIDGCNLSEFSAALSKRRSESGQAADKHHGVAIVDGRPTAISGYVVDRPGIFVSKGSDGRSMTGRYRRRITPADVTVNVGASSPVPPPATGPHGTGQLEWGAVVHDPFVDWIAKWRDPVTARIKYARLAPGTATEQKAELKKYELARRLWRLLPLLRKQVAAALVSSSARRQQLGVCLWLVHQYALRIGGGSVQEAIMQGSHGATTLLVRHVRASAGGVVAIKFPGKDGVPFEATAVGAPDPLVRAIKRCTSGRKSADALLPLVNADMVNRALDALLPGATAKVLRTARASALFEETVAECEATFISSVLSSSAATPTSKSAAYRLAVLIASARVSIMCNHRRRSPHHRSDSESELLKLNSAIDLSEGALAAIMTAAKRRGAMSAADLRDLTRDLRRNVIGASNLNLPTARANYIDPRIVYALCARCALTCGPRVLPVQTVYPAGSSLETRFSWAARTPASFRWRSAPSRTSAEV